MKQGFLIFALVVVAALPGLTAEPLTLGQALALAVKDSPEAGIAQARMARARAKLGEADAAFLPRVVLGGAYSGSSNGATVFAYRGQQASIPNGMDFNDTPDSDNLNAHLTAIMPLYTGGQSTALRESARAGTRAVEQSREAVMQALEFEVARAFHSVGKAKAFTAAAQAAVDAYSAHLALAQKRHAGGAALKTDVLDLEVRLATAQADAAHAESAIKLATAALKALLGMEQEASLEVAEEAGGIREAKESEESKEGKEGKTGTNRTDRTDRSDRTDVAERADVRAAREQVLAAQAVVRAAAAGKRPRVNAFATVEENAGVTHDGNLASWTAGVAVEWDIFDGHLTRSKISAAKAELQGAQEEARRVRLEASLECERARLSLEDAARQLALTEKVVGAAAESAKLTRARYEQGLALVTQLVDAESALTAARVRRAQAEADRLIAAAAVRKAEGKRQK